jgi:hypothetical protein
MYSQASLIVPLAIPNRLPSGVFLDRSSPWHVSALFNAAVESTLLYTRMKTTDHVNSTSFGTVTDLLNVFGKQTIANLQMGLVEPPKPAQNGTSTVMQLPTGRGEMYDRLNALEYEEQSDAGSSSGVTSLGVDLSTIEEGITSSASFRTRRRPHLFSQLCTARGEDATKGFDEDEPVNEYRRYERPKTHK